MDSMTTHGRDDRTTGPHDDRRGARRRAALLCGGLAVSSAAAPRLARLLGRWMPPRAADAASVAGLVIGGVAVIAGMERRHPFRPEWNEPDGDVGTDVADLLVSDGWGRSAASAMTAPLRGAIRSRRDRSGRTGPIAGWPLPAQVLTLLVAFDLGHYTLHRTMHERVGWSIHAPHHSPRRLYWLNATRFHPIEMAMDGVWEMLTVAALGPSHDADLAYQVARGTYGQIQHANVDIDSGVLDAVLSTPERHRWHHSERPEEGNSNYGAVVALWDHLFGSAGTPDRDFDAPLGNGDPDYPRSWRGQLAAPFRPARTAV